MQSTDLAVSAIVEHEGRFLFVEEYASGRRVFSQPGGHIESGESPEAAVVRETLEETGCHVECGELVGVYLWVDPTSGRQYVRIVFVADYLGCDDTLELDDGVIARHWMTVAELESRRFTLRSPAVLRCMRDYVSGTRQPGTALADMMPLQRHVDRVLASARVV
jgi:8-oxo-dGTP pyrophosphatase MutT (NUDIX family)